MFLGGGGGSGKSRVIDAVSFFAKSWGRPGAVRTCATTGIAATLVKGQTFHSFAKIFERGNTQNQRKIKTFKIIEEFQELELLFVDEVSMLAGKFVAKLDSFLREVKERPGCRLGNVMVVFCGHFFQIPPIRSDPFYIDPTQSKYRTTLEDRIGFDIWSLDSVVILPQNMRQSSDKRYDGLLKRLRHGKISNEDIDLLNSHVIQSATERDQPSTRPRLSDFGPMVVKQSNKLRNALNWECIARKTRLLGIRPIVCVANLSARNGNSFTRKDLQFLFATNDTQTRNLSVLLPLLPGMPVRVTQNVAVEIVIANGTEGCLVGMQFKNYTEFEATTIFHMECLVPSKLPAVAFVELRGAGLSHTKRFKPVPKQFSDQTIPLVALEIQGFQAKLGTMQLASGNKITMKQLPFVPSFASTTYKIQGIKTPRLILFPLLKGVGGKVPPGTLYVALSRVNTRNALFLVEPITEEHRRYFVPSQLLVEE